MPEPINKIDKEVLFRTVVESIRSTLDINSTKKAIVEVVGKALNADRCFIMEYDKHTDKFLKVDEEYLSSSDLLSYIGVDLNENIPYLTSKFKLGKRMLLSEFKALFGDEVVEIRDESLEKEKLAMAEYNVYSALVFPLFYINDFLGDLVIHYVEKKHEAGEEEIRLLEGIANQIAIALHQASLYKAVQKNAQRENVFRTVIETIRSTIDIGEIRQIIVNTIGKVLDADRCFITDYDKNENRFLTIKDEYLSSDKITSCRGQDVQEIVPGFIEALKEGKYLLIQNKKIFLDTKEQIFEIEGKTIEQNGINSAFAVSLFYQKELLGVLSIQYVNRVHEIGDFEINLMKDVASQTAMAIHQASLYEITQMQAEREKLFARIIARSIKTFDINEMKHIVKDIGMIMNASRCYFVELDSENMKGIPIEQGSEYLASPDVKSILGYEFDTQDVGMVIKMLLEAKNVVIYDYEKFREENKEELQGIIRYANLFDIKSGIAIPLFNGDILTSVLVIEYVKEKVLPNEDELDFLKTLGVQVSMVHNQIKLYQTAKEVAEREIILRRIIEAARISMDITEVKKKLTYEIGKVFGADRCFFRTYSHKLGQFTAPDVEYLSSDSISSLIGVEPNQEVLKFFAEEVKRQNMGFYPIVMSEENSKNTPLESYLKEVGVKANYAIPVISKRDEITWLILHYCKKDPKFGENDKELLETIAYQIDIAFEQIVLYDETKKNAEREALIRDITEKIRSSLDIQETLTFICEEVAKLFDVQRSFVVEFKTHNNLAQTMIKKEFLSNPEIKGLKDEKFDIRTIDYWGSVLLSKGENIIIDNIPESDAPDYFKETYKNIGEKSTMGLAIKKGDDTWGWIGVAEYNYYRHWTEEEVSLLRTISNQIYIAIKQAELYAKEKLSFEREKISKNIIEILRSSIDKTIIKKLFVKNIGKFFDADRVLFSDYDDKTKMYLPVDENSEYLSSDKEKSFIGYDWSDPTIREYIQPILEKRELNIFNWVDYIKENKRTQEFIELFEDANVKSSYNFPVLYQQKIMGYFCVEFTNRICMLSDEDIARIRNICTQAGIALYHAELYSMAQKCRVSEESFSDISRKIEEPVNNILDKSMLLSKNEFERAVQVEYLGNIIGSCNELLELTKDVTEN